MWYLKTRSKRLADLTAGYKLFGPAADGYYYYGDNPYAVSRAYFRGYSTWPRFYKTESTARAQASRLISKYATSLEDLSSWAIDICHHEPAIIKKQ